VATRSARPLRFVSRPPTDASRWRRLTGASVLTGRSTRTLLAVAWSLPLRPRACLRLRGRARSIAPAERGTPTAAPSTCPSPVVAAASVARAARRSRLRLLAMASTALGFPCGLVGVRMTRRWTPPSYSRRSLREQFTTSRGLARYGPDARRARGCPPGPFWRAL
jgi:hypothetical protein